jgi:hypothetical protein
MSILFCKACQVECREHEARCVFNMTVLLAASGPDKWHIQQESEVLQCRDGLSNKVSNIIRRHIDNTKLLLICILLLSHSFIFFRIYFFVNVYVVVLLFNTVIYVFLLLCLRILILCLCISSWQLAIFGYLTECFPCFFLSCKANATVKPSMMGHGPHSSKIFVLFCDSFVLCRSVYCLCVNVFCTTVTGWLPNCS